jgi:hypothetical protein
MSRVENQVITYHEHSPSRDHVIYDFGWRQTRERAVTITKFWYTFDTRAFHDGILIYHQKYRVFASVYTRLGYPEEILLTEFSLGDHTLDSDNVTSFGHIHYQEVESELFVSLDSPAPLGSGHLDFEMDDIPDLLISRVKGCGFGQVDLVRLPSSDKAVTYFLPRIQRFAAKYQYDIHATSLFSSGDAVSKLDIDSNFFETIPEMASYLHLASSGINAVIDVKAVLKGDLSGLLRLCRDAAEGYLTFIYGVKPLVSDVENLASIMRSEIIMRSKEKYRVARGSFSHTFDAVYASEIGEGKLSLLSSSKVVINGLSALADVFVGLGQVGFKPTLKNAWDLVPFSFVADWFVNFSDRYSDIDNTLLLHVLQPTYFVHSYKLRYTPSREEVRQLGLDFDSDPWFQV